MQSMCASIGIGSIHAMKSRNHTGSNSLRVYAFFAVICTHAWLHEMHTLSTPTREMKRRSEVGCDLTAHIPSGQGDRLAAPAVSVEPAPEAVGPSAHERVVAGRRVASRLPRVASGGSG